MKDRKLKEILGILIKWKKRFFFPDLLYYKMILSYSHKAFLELYAIVFILNTAEIIR